MSANPIEQSLELLAEKDIDPVPQVYARVSERFPEADEQFVLDKDMAARGQMLSQFFDCVLDHIATRHFSDAFIQSEMVNHDGLGISNKTFASFFGIVQETVCELLGNDWTPEMESAWGKMVKEMKAVVSENS